MVRPGLPLATRPLGPSATGWWVVAIALVASSAAAEVRLLVRPDGRKLIYNTPSRRPARATDFIWLAKQRNRASIYDRLIEKYSEEQSLDPILVKAIIQVESNYDPACVSRKGARGLMQLMPGTARRFQVTDIHDPEQNIRGGVTYLARLFEMFPSDLPRALAAYNAGENAVLRHRGVPPYEETTTYVNRALTVYYGCPWGGFIEIGRRSTGLLSGGFKGSDIRRPVSTASDASGRYPLGPASYFAR